MWTERIVYAKIAGTRAFKERCGFRLVVTTFYVKSFLHFY